MLEQREKLITQHVPPASLCYSLRQSTKVHFQSLSKSSTSPISRVSSPVPSDSTCKRAEELNHHSCLVGSFLYSSHDIFPSWHRVLLHRGQAMGVGSLPKTPPCNNKVKSKERQWKTIKQNKTKTKKTKRNRIWYVPPTLACSTLLCIWSLGTEENILHSSDVLFLVSEWWWTLWVCPR